MKPVQELPQSYQSIGTLDLSKDRKAAIAINLAGIVLLFLFGWLFNRALLLLRGDVARNVLSFEFGSLLDLGVFILVALGTMGLMIVVHEAIHGVFFWLFTRSRPVFAYKIWYAYATAPGWYLPRGQYLIVALAPLVIISLVGLGLMAVLPLSWLAPLLFLLIMNAAGAVGDLAVAGWLILQKPGVYAADRGDAVTLYQRIGSDTLA
jgi:hypothetical protein